MTETGNYTNDNELIAAIRGGDEAAFRFLVEKFSKKVISTSMGFVHSEADSDDIAQEVFIEVFRSIGRFRADSSLSTWIYRITVNKALNFLKRSHRRKLVSFFEDDNEKGIYGIKEPASDKDTCPDSNLTKSEQSTALEAAMGKLAANQRTAFILSRYDGLSYEETAKIMNLSIPAVESLIFRAKQNLQKSLYSFYKKNIG